MTLNASRFQSLRLILIVLALFDCASCASKSPEPTVVVMPPKQWSPADAEPVREMPATRPAEMSLSPSPSSVTPMPPTVEPTLAPTTEPSSDQATVPPRAEPATRRAKAADDLEQPGPDNTGVADQKKLKISGKIVARSGQVIENLFITGGIVASDTRNVVIRNCLIDGGGGWYGLYCAKAVNLTIEHCEVYNMTAAAIAGDGFTARWNNVYQSGGDGFKAGDACVIESNWVHTLGFKDPKAHADGVQIRGGSNVKIIGNYFDMPLDEPDAKSNASVFIQGIKGKRPASDIVIERNWMRGGNFSIHAYTDGGDGSTIKVFKNRFYRGSARYGVISMENGVVFRDNVFDEDDSRCNAGSK